MKVQIRSISMNKRTRAFIRERTENIETDNNAIFAGVENTNEGMLIIEQNFERFWNGPEDEEIVKVIGVRVL